MRSRIFKCKCNQVFYFRYADRAKRIVNHAVVNEDPNARIIRELRAEIDALKEMLLSANQPGNALTEKLNENEKLVKEMKEEEKLLGFLVPSRGEEEDELHTYSSSLPI